MRREWACYEGVFSADECARIVELGLERERNLGTVGLKKGRIDPAIRHSEVAFIERKETDVDRDVRGPRLPRRGSQRGMVRRAGTTATEPARLQFTVYDGAGDHTDFYGPHEDGGLTIRKRA